MFARSFAIAACIAAGSQAVVSDANASVAAVFSLPQTSCCTSGLLNGLDGFDFTPSSDIVVTALGWYDSGSDGLKNAHPVGIYLTSTQQLLAPAVTVTTSSPLDAATGFRFESMAPLSLLANIRYTIVGYGEGPDWDFYVTNPSGGVIFHPLLAYNGWRTATATGLAFPTQTGNLVQQQFFGANFRFNTVNAVPEPSTLILATSAFAAIVALSTRRRIRNFSITED
jgi:hypothetical protein